MHATFTVKILTNAGSLIDAQTLAGNQKTSSSAIAERPRCRVK